MDDEVRKQIFEDFKKMITTESVVGQPIYLGDATIVPFVDISFGFGTGSQPHGGRAPPDHSPSRNGSLPKGYAPSSPRSLSPLPPPLGKGLSPSYLVREVKEAAQSLARLYGP